MAHFTFSFAAWCMRRVRAPGQPSSDAEAAQNSTVAATEPAKLVPSIASLELVLPTLKLEAWLDQQIAGSKNIEIADGNIVLLSITIDW